MPLIKRYSNRKLYDTNAKQYITLSGIASLIREGNEVQVIDNATGGDLTSITLTQVIAEEEKKQGGRLSGSILAELIQAGSDKIILRHTLLEREIEGVLHKREIPTRADFEGLLAQLDTLSTELENLSKK